MSNLTDFVVPKGLINDYDSACVPIYNKDAFTWV